MTSVEKQQNFRELWLSGKPTTASLQQLIVLSISSDAVLIWLLLFQSNSSLPPQQRPNESPGSATACCGALQSSLWLLLLLSQSAKPHTGVKALQSSALTTSLRKHAVFTSWTGIEMWETIQLCLLFVQQKDARPVQPDFLCVHQTCRWKGSGLIPKSTSNPNSHEVCPLNYILKRTSFLILKCWNRSYSVLGPR